MSRWIDEEWLLDYFADDIDYYGKYVREDIKDNMPSIDIVPCVECRYKGMEICPMYKLTKAGVLKPYDFCSYGERQD